MPPAEKPEWVQGYSPRDETDLLWFFGPGQALSERSPMGGMLDHAAAFQGMRSTWPMAPVLTADGVCIGWESAVTARPTAEVREASGYVPDIGLMERAARVSRILLAVERQDGGRLAVTVLGLYFGESGNRWSLGTTGHGRVGALYHLTQKGLALATAAAQEPNAIQIPAPQRIEVLAAVNKARPTEERSAALAKCCRQAEQLEQEARRQWHIARQSLARF